MYAAPPYALLNEHAVSNFDTAFRLNPPLRMKVTGWLSCKALQMGRLMRLPDHAPVNRDEKAQPFGQASPGASGIETLFPNLMTMVANNSLSMMQAITAASRAPARILGLSGGSQRQGHQLMSFVSMRQAHM